MPKNRRKPSKKYKKITSQKKIQKENSSPSYNKLTNCSHYSEEIKTPISNYEPNNNTPLIQSTPKRKSSKNSFLQYSGILTAPSNVSKYHKIPPLISPVSADLLNTPKRPSKYNIYLHNKKKSKSKHVQSKSLNFLSMQKWINKIEGKENVEFDETPKGNYYLQNIFKTPSVKQNDSPVDLLQTPIKKNVHEISCLRTQDMSHCDYLIPDVVPVDLKTPSKRVRTDSIEHLISPPLVQSEKRTKNATIENFAQNYTSLFTTDKLTGSHISTPKNLSDDDQVTIINKRISFLQKKFSFNGIRKKNVPSQYNSTKDVIITIDRLSSPNCSIFQRCSKSIVNFFTNFGTTVHRKLSSIRTLFNKKISINERFEDLYTQMTEIKNENENLKMKIDLLVNVVNDLKSEIASKTTAPPCAPPPPPPPPPPPLPLGISSTPRSFKTATRKLEKQNTFNNSRPTISLDDILNVKLKKTSTRTNPIRKNMESIKTTFIPENMLKKTSLRSSTRTISPLRVHASLVNILQSTDVDIGFKKRFNKYKTVMDNTH